MILLNKKFITLDNNDELIEINKFKKSITETLNKSNQKTTQKRTIPIKKK